MDETPVAGVDAETSVKSTDKERELESTSTICVHCTGPITTPVKKCFCSWQCYLMEISQ